jgi:hypothetical protein
MGQKRRGNAKTAVEQAHWGELSGLNFAGQVRLSFETMDDDDEATGSSYVPQYGTDIKGRDVQEQDNREFVTKHGGTYVYTYEEADTRAASNTGRITSRRQRRKHRAMQAAGIPTGGTRPFGWQADKHTLNAREAEKFRRRRNG